jgi:mannitol/fructose-specific phosphotransferase system IIA component (Ntr-type)
MKFTTVYVKVEVENNMELYERLTQWYVKHGYVVAKDTKKKVTHVFTGNSIMVFGVHGIIFKGVDIYVTTTVKQKQKVINQLMNLLRKMGIDTNNQIITDEDYTIA